MSNSLFLSYFLIKIRFFELNYPSKYFYNGVDGVRSHSLKIKSFVLYPFKLQPQSFLSIHFLKAQTTIKVIRIYSGNSIINDNMALNMGGKPN